MNCKSFFYLLALTVVTFSSCKKNSIKGEPGEQGTPGVPGAPGANGSKILSGTGVPAATLGIDGDYYLDIASSVFYGPKASSAWTTSINLKGEAGADGSNGSDGSSGTNGSTILNGTTAPGLSLGNVGDFYINTATTEFYGPKTTSSWGSAISLKGSQGGSGTGNGVKIEFYRQQRFTNITYLGEPEYPGSPYQWETNLRITPNNYLSDNENGLVLVYLKNIADPEAGWEPEISEHGFEAWSINRKNYININGSFSNQSATYEAFVRAYAFDIKVVTLSATLARTMTANNIDTQNIKAVENFLKLNK
ncbi:collagen-like protein [Pedobacter gandavensis]|uniref:collagen-like triple helix repeat-containing protein n=1 Tax=Pedobacter gandavensis TaxID=2679963 RepID=UPI00292E074C|nr:collagen-like protein [Pedobacter gandavensis]